MERIPIIMSGMPGKMVKEILQLINAQYVNLFSIYGNSLGIRNEEQYIYQIDETDLYHAMKSNYYDHEDCLQEYLDENPNGIVVDFTEPDAVNINAKLYANVGIPFVMGTTGGDRELLIETVKNSNISAVIDTNMGIPLVVFKTMVEYAAREFPGALNGFNLLTDESHQESKKDVSGTAKSIVPSFVKLGANDYNGIESIRDPQRQKLLGIKNLEGHGYHWYNLLNTDIETALKFSTQVEGRKVYAEGTLHAIYFLYKKVQEGSKGEVFTMIDVLKPLNS